jgi:DNA replication licensing factor MCM7
VPRQFQVHCEGVNVRCCSPGDLVSLNGVFLPSPRESFLFSQGSSLILDTYIFCHSVQREKKKYVELELSSERVEFLIES